MTPSFALDSSMALAWCFADEATDSTRGVLRRLRAESAIVPTLWYLEVANVLVLAERRQRISRQDAAEFLKLLAALDLQVDDVPATHVFSDILELSRELSITAYDAVYLELAMRRQLPLATLDKQVIAAAGQRGVTILS